MQKSCGQWTQNVSEAVILCHTDGSLGLTIKGGADFGEFPYLGELKQDNIRYQSGSLNQNDIILEVQDQKVAGFTQRDVVLWMKHCSTNAASVVVKVTRAGELPKELKKYLSVGYPKGSEDHELQSVIRDNLYMRAVPCTTRTPRDGEVNGQDYWFVSQDDFNELDHLGHLLESGFHGGNYYGTPKPPHSPLAHKADPIADIIRPGGHPSSEGKRRRNRSNVEALSPEVSQGSTDDWTLTRSCNQENDSRDHLRNGREDDHDEEVHHYVAPQMKQDGGLWGNIASQAVAKSRLVDSGHHSEEDNSARRMAEELPYGWEKVDDPSYGTYYIDHINKRTQYDHPGRLSADHSVPSTYSSSTFPRIKKRGPDSPDQTNRIPKSTSSDVRFNDKSKILTIESLRGDLMDVTLIKGSKGLGFTVIGGESKFPNADFEDDERSLTAGTILQLKSIAPGGPAQVDGRLRAGDALVLINDRNVLGFTHDQVIQLFQSIQPGEQVRMRICRGYPLPPDATDPRTQVITTDISSTTSSNHVGTFSRSKSNVEMPRYVVEDTRAHITDNTDQEVAAAFSEQLQVASGPLYKLPMVKGSTGFGFTIAESPDGQIIKKINDKKRCQGLLEGDLLVEINGRQVRGLDHTAVVEVLKEAQTDYPSEFVVQRAQRIEGRKEQRSGRVMGRSKTPTAEMYKTSNSQDFSAKKQRSKTPTPRSSSSLFGFFRSKTPKPGKENVGEINLLTRRSTSQERLRNGETSVMTVHRDRSPAKTVSPPAISPSAGDSDFKRNQFAYSSMQRIITPSYIPASQYTKKTDEKTSIRTQPVEESAQEWNTPVYAATRSHPVVEHNSFDPRPSKLRINGGYENGLSAPGLEGDNESQLHSPPGYIDLVVTLRREETGFGFRIVGGSEEGTQVFVGYVVPGGAAERDGRIEQGDEILNVDGISVIGAEHRQVIQMMQRSSQNGHVVLGIRRKISYAVVAPLQVTIQKQAHEGFGFVIISSVARNQQIGGVSNGVPTSYPSLGRILPDSPAFFCGQLHVGDKILAVNGVDVLHLHHSEIVQMIKDSGTLVTLTIEPQSAGIPDDASTISANSQQRYDEFAQQEPDGAFDRNSFATAGTTKAEYHAIQLERGFRGFGFSIRGGKEFHNMSLFVLRIAENGAAAVDGRLRVGDEIIEINGINTKEFTHSEAIDLIKRGKEFVRLLIRRNGTSEGLTSPNGGFSSASLPQSPSNNSMQYATTGKQYSDGHVGSTFSPSYSTYQPPASFAYAGSSSLQSQYAPQASSAQFQPSRLYGPRYNQNQNQQFHYQGTSAK